ncbi:hypothetical protein THAOC_19325, partial [Thalassiosira oceanica]
VDETVLAEASRGLTELGGETLGVHETNNDPDQSHDILVPPAEDEGNNIVIREKDRKLLAGEVLNDTLVDFWMRWISRGENPQISSVHFFPAQFYRVLQGGGPEVVASWTASIDIFKKKFVFVPINKDMHWSLCVIVNPGEIASVYDEDVPSECEHPCLLFLDSLKMHNKDRIRKMLLKWLNFEWMAKKKGEEDDGRVLPRDPFQNNSMNLIVPKEQIKKNDNKRTRFPFRHGRHRQDSNRDEDSDHEAREEVLYHVVEEGRWGMKRCDAPLRRCTPPLLDLANWLGFPTNSSRGNTANFHDAARFPSRTVDASLHSDYRFGFAPAGVRGGREVLLDLRGRRRIGLRSPRARAEEAARAPRGRQEFQVVELGPRSLGAPRRQDRGETFFSRGCPTLDDGFSKR